MGSREGGNCYDRWSCVSVVIESMGICLFQSLVGVIPLSGQCSDRSSRSLRERSEISEKWVRPML